MDQPQIFLLNKPYGVLCKFTDKENRPTLRDFFSKPGFYPAGRLDMDSEGLVILTNNGKWQQKISDPKFKMEKGYWVQVEGEISEAALKQLQNGVSLSDYRTLPAKALRIAEPENLWQREIPIRFRKNIPTSWLELYIKEGKNRQVRKMTASVGFPTLRLIRFRIGQWSLENLISGKYRILNEREIGVIAR